MLIWYFNEKKIMENKELLVKLKNLQQVIKSDDYYILSHTFVEDTSGDHLYSYLKKQKAAYPFNNAFILPANCADKITETFPVKLIDENRYRCSGCSGDALNKYLEENGIQIKPLRVLLYEVTKEKKSTITREDILSLVNEIENIK